MTATRIKVRLLFRDGALATGEEPWARRGKAGMQDRLRECGVPSAEQVKSTNVEELASWVREREARLGAEVAYPVVVKPTGGSVGEVVFLHFRRRLSDCA